MSGPSCGWKRDAPAFELRPLPVAVLYRPQSATKPQNIEQRGAQELRLRQVQTPIGCGSANAWSFRRPRALRPLQNKSSDATRNRCEHTKPRQAGSLPVRGALNQTRRRLERMRATTEPNPGSAARARQQGVIGRAHKTAGLASRSRPHTDVCESFGLDPFSERRFEGTHTLCADAVVNLLRSQLPMSGVRPERGHARAVASTSTARRPRSRMLLYQPGSTRATAVSARRQGWLPANGGESDVSFTALSVAAKWDCCSDPTVVVHALREQ